MECVTIAEAAHRLAVSTRMVWKLIGEGHFITGHRRNQAVLPATKVREFADAVEAAGLLERPTMRTYGAVEATDRHFVRAMDAAETLGISRQRLQQVIRDGALAAYHIGRCVVLRPADVRGYLAWKNGDKPPRRPQPVLAPEDLDLSAVRGDEDER